MTALLVALGASLGTALRYLAGHHLDHVFPRGTLLVNLLGSFVIGVLSGLALDGEAMALLGTGFCGGLTTFSAFAVKSTELGARHGTAYVVVTVFWSVVLCALGLALGRQA